MNYGNKILDPMIVAKLSTMLLRARFVVDGYFSGLHESPLKGYSLEFAQHREYSQGDELKHLDWKVFARSDRYYVKQYREETSLRCQLLVDTSASMGYGSAGISKITYAGIMAAALSYLMIKQQDAVGLTTFDSGIKKHIPSKQTSQHLSVIMNELEAMQASEKTGFTGALQEFAAYIKKRSLIIVISDLFDEQAEVMKALKNFRFKKNEIIVFQLLDRAELELPYGESVLYEDLETGEKILSEPEIIRREYRSAMNAFTENYKLNCRNSDIDYCLVNTSQPLEVTLGQYLSRREKLR